MMKPYRDYDDGLLKALIDPQEAAAYLNAALEEEDPALFLRALGQVVRAHGVSNTAEQADINRVSIYKILGEAGNPELRSVGKILHALGLKLAVEVERAA